MVLSTRSPHVDLVAHALTEGDDVPGVDDHIRRAAPVGVDVQIAGGGHEGAGPDVERLVLEPHLPPVAGEGVRFKM